MSSSITGIGNRNGGGGDENNNNNRYHSTTTTYSSSGGQRHGGGGNGQRGSGGGGGGRGQRGRGEYYKNKYGRPKNNNHLNINDTATSTGSSHTLEEEDIDHHRTNSRGNRGGGGTYQDLRQLLQSIDGGQYPKYDALETSIHSISDIHNRCNNSSGGIVGGWIYPSKKNGSHSTTVASLFTLFIGTTQSDPFAPPTRCRIVVPIVSQQVLHDLLQSPIRRMATCDYLWRQIYNYCQTTGAYRTLQDTNSSTGGTGGGGRSWSGPKGGDIQIIEPTQHVVEQSAVQIDTTQSYIVLHLTINLPARGRTILGNVAYHIFDTILSDMVQTCLCTFHMNNLDNIRQHVNCIDDQAYIQNQLHIMGLVSFICNGAILPHRSGIDDRPMIQPSTNSSSNNNNNNNNNNSHHIEPFISPPSMEVSITLPNSQRTIVGMGIPKGITLICGGGYHGKSTLLDAIQYGIYYKIPNDGREYCMTSTNATKIRAEDGRWVNQVDVSSFIKNIPSMKDTSTFSSPDASGSTSQASNIVEAIELGADVLLMDEDTCATNFMIRDTKMMQLVACDKEPITPYIRVVQPLKEQYNISTILVVGGTGDYFHVADHVLVMDSYRCIDTTVRAKQIAVSQDKDDNNNITTSTVILVPPRKRYPVLKKMQCSGKMKVLARNIISYGDVEIDLSMTEQIISKYQANAIASILKYLSSSPSLILNEQNITLNEILDAMDTILNDTNVDGFHHIGPMNGAFLRPRKLEIGAAINRLRILNCIEQRTITHA